MSRNDDDDKPEFKIVNHDKDHCNKAGSCSCWHATCCSPPANKQVWHCYIPEQGCHKDCSG